MLADHHFRFLSRLVLVTDRWISRELQLGHVSTSSSLHANFKVLKSMTLNTELPNGPQLAVLFVEGMDKRYLTVLSTVCFKMIDACARELPSHVFCTGLVRLTSYLNVSTSQFACESPWDVTLIRGVRRSVYNKRRLNSEQARKSYDTGGKPTRNHETYLNWDYLYV